MKKPRRKTAKKKQTERLSLHPLTPEEALKKMLGVLVDPTPEQMVPRPNAGKRRPDKR